MFGKKKKIFTFLQTKKKTLGNELCDNEKFPLKLKYDFNNLIF